MFQPTSNLNETLSTLMSGAAHTVDAKITIAGALLPSFASLELKQTTTKHHEFTIKLDKDLLNPAKAMEIDLYTQQYLGQSLSVTFYYKDLSEGSGPENYFTGVVTSVGFEQEDGYHGHVILKGYSPTVLLDDKLAPHIQSFSNKNLQSLVQEILAQGSDVITKMPVEIKPRYTSAIPYSCQYDETHYNYLCRLAASYGEWFYYDGITLYFGKPLHVPEPIKLIYGRDVRKVNINTQARHTGNRKFDYDALGHQPMRVSDNKEIEGMDLPGEIALNISKKVFATESRTPSVLRSDFQFTLDNSEAYKRGAAATEMFTVTGITTVPLLHPGCKVELHMQDPLTTAISPVTTFLITESIHKLDRKNKYSCAFKGIPSKVLHIPEPEFQQPVAAPQLATVKNNTDKENKGRVQVQFAWQERSGEMTDFIRVMTPDAGGSDKVKSNRGLVTIPEVGDQVMVGFELNHPDRPYVMGSMFHGLVGGGGGTGNNVKSLSSKSGHTVTLNDGGGITVIDKTKLNHIEVDGNDTITVTAAQKITLTNGQSSIVLNGDTITIHATNIEIANGDKNGGTIDAAKIDIKAKATTMNGTTTLDIKAGKLTEKATETIDIDASGVITINGSETDIN